MMDCIVILCVMIITYMIISPSINDGIIIKLGLMCIAIGLLALLGSTEDSRAIENQALTICIGVLVVLLGIGLKIVVGKFRRMSDWFKVDSHYAEDRRKS